MNLYAGLSLALFLLQQPAINQVRDQLFIGQVYPSGNVYIKSFSENRVWPKELSLVPLVGERVPSRAALVSDRMETAYIPAIEGMDDQHDPCGALPTKPLDLSFEYLSDEFFNGMIDYCEANEDVAVYHTEPSQFSYSVLAISSDVVVGSVRLVEGPRPMTETERQRVEEEKRQTDKIAKDCTTVPAYIDSAAVFLEAGLANGITLRLSSYKNPGCAGHLSTIYLVDLLRGNAILTTLQLVQNQGLL